MPIHSYRLLKIFALVVLALFFYFFARVEFLIWNWELFKSKPFLDLLWSFVVGLRFDISAAIAVTAPLLVYSLIPWPARWQGGWKWATWILFSLLHLPFLLLNLVDVVFINFVGRRFSYDSLFIVNEVPGKMWNFVTSYWGLFVINSLLLVAFVWSARRVLFKGREQGFIEGTWKVSLYHVAACFLALSVAVIGIRGGLQKKPVSFVNANIFTTPMLNNLVLNSSFTFIKSYGKESLPRVKYFSDFTQMRGHLNGQFIEAPLLPKLPPGPQNVVIIILEGFGEEFFGPVNGGKSYTPFLDSLMSKSLVFKNVYANGRRSIEGVGAVLAGIPALMNEPFISSHFTSNYFVGLGTWLAPRGYSSSFFHGGQNGTMYFDSFTESAGFKKYFGAKEYANPADDDGVWGIWDEPFLQWMVTRLDDEPQPFLSAVFTLTSHQPFKVPPQYKDQFPEGPIEILKTISYTDYALQKFFAEAEKKEWFKNTLFVVTADHASQHYRPEWQNEAGNYRIPLFFYHPGVVWPRVDTEKVVQQIDIVPSILDLLRIPEKDKNYLSSSVFADGDKVALNFIDGRYVMHAKDYSMRWAPGQEEPQMFAIADRNGEQELSEPSERRQQLTQKLKAAIQYFNDGMWDNKLYYDGNSGK